MLKGLFAQRVSLGAANWIIVCIGKIFFEGWSLNDLFSVKNVKNYPKYMVLVLSRIVWCSSWLLSNYIRWISGN